MQAYDQEEVITIKGKRSKRPRPSSPLALTMATSSSSTAEFSGSGDLFRFLSCGGDVSAGSSVDRRTTNSDDVQITHSSTDDEEEDMAHCLILLARGGDRKSTRPVAAAAPYEVAPVEIYQCKTCDKRFPSFQALGGHRASHKKPIKPTTLSEKPNRLVTEKQDNFQSENTSLSLQISSKVSVGGSGGESKSRVHECSICGAEFASGQALGGHMRRHRPLPPARSSVHSGESSISGHQEVKKPRNMLSLDLNLPAPEEDHHKPESKFGFGRKEQVMVFSTFPLVDCHY